MGIFDYKKKTVDNIENNANSDSGYLLNDSKDQYTRQQRQRMGANNAGSSKVVAESRIEHNIKRNFIITKRKKPLKFLDINLKNTDYEYVNNERQATIFDSMTDVMSMMDKLFKNGEKGFWYREVRIVEELEDHLYVFVLNTKVKKYIGLNTMRGNLFFTQNVQNAYKCRSLSDILEFGINYIPKDTLDSLQLVDLKEQEYSKMSRYLFSDSLDNPIIDEWELLGDGEAFKKFTSIIEYNVESNEDSDVFKREVMKLLGARKYIMDNEDASNKDFTKNALINLFSKMILIKADRENLLYIEWFIRSKLMLPDEVRWIVCTKWFNNTVEILKKRYT